MFGDRPRAGHWPVTTASIIIVLVFETLEEKSDSVESRLIPFKFVDYQITFAAPD